MERNCDNCKYRDVWYMASPCDECIFEYQRQPQKGFQNRESDAMTNADRIRAMSDEELATWLNCMQSNAYHCGEFGRLNAAYPFDNKAWLDWLKKEVTT